MLPGRRNHGLLVRCAKRRRPEILGDAIRARSLSGIDVEMLDPGDENELGLLIEAQHLELEDALQETAR